MLVFSIVLISGHYDVTRLVELKHIAHQDVVSACCELKHGGNFSGVEASQNAREARSSTVDLRIDEIEPLLQRLDASLVECLDVHARMKELAGKRLWVGCKQLVNFLHDVVVNSIPRKRYRARVSG